LREEKVDSFYCVTDNLYRVSVYIKVDAKQFEEVIVSFHESNKQGHSLLVNFQFKQPK